VLNYRLTRLRFATISSSADESCAPIQWSSPTDPIQHSFMSKYTTTFDTDKPLSEGTSESTL
jgi:hypothetical protein